MVTSRYDPYPSEIFRKENFGGWIAQLVEHRTENPGVGGSIPPPATFLHFVVRRFWEVIFRGLIIFRSTAFSSTESSGLAPVVDIDRRRFAYVSIEICLPLIEPIFRSTLPPIIMVTSFAAPGGP